MIDKTILQPRKTDPMTDRVIQTEPAQTFTAPAKHTAEQSGSDPKPRGGPASHASQNKGLRQRMTDAEKRARQLCELAIELTKDKERDRRDMARVLTSRASALCRGHGSRRGLNSRDRNNSNRSLSQGSGSCWY